MALITRVKTPSAIPRFVFTKAVVMVLLCIAFPYGSQAQEASYTKAALAALEHLTTELAITRLGFRPTTSAPRRPPVQTPDTHTFVTPSDLQVVTDIEVFRETPFSEQVKCQVTFRPNVRGAGRNWWTPVKMGYICTNLRTGALIKMKGSTRIISGWEYPASFSLSRGIAKSGTYAVTFIVMGQQQPNGHWELIDVQHTVVRIDGDISVPELLRSVGIPKRARHSRSASALSG